MIAAILKILCGVLIIAAVVFWIHCLCEWDGTRPCQPEDCKNCPFPPCEDKPINNRKGRLKQ